MNRKKIAVAGAGYVGLSLAVLLAQKNKVRLYDISEERAQMIRRKVSPVRDKELEEYLSSAALDLKTETDAPSAFREADFIIIAVPTDYDEETGYFDTSAVESVLSLAKEYAPDAFSVIKSTVPVGYTTSVRKKMKNSRIFFSPEFLRETKALYDNLYPSRIIVGADLSDAALTEAASAFAGLLKDASQKPDADILIMDSSEAEAVKLFSNAYLAMRVGFFNELDTYAESEGLDTQRIIRGVCLDPRIGDWYNNPSFGYGGYCLPKDTKQLLAGYAGIPQNLIGAVVDANETRKDFIAGRILSLAGYPAKPPVPPAASGSVHLSDPAESSDTCVIGIYRLIMKSGSDNFRHSAVLGIIKRLQRKENVSLLIYEPSLPDGSSFLGIPVTSDLKRFKRICRAVLANRFDENLEDIRKKVYTRDVFHRD